MPRPLVIAADRVITPTGDLTPGVVEVRNGRIARVRKGRARRAHVTVRGAVLAPGLIDLQINGAAGIDFATCDSPRDLHRAHRFLLSTGVTAYLPTLISSPLVQLRAALVHWQRFATVAQAPRVLGVHLEGPYLNGTFAGAHDLDYLRTPDLEEFTSILDMAPGLIRLVTMAPELDGAAGLIKAAMVRKVTVSAGHTAATYEQAQAAFEAGVSMITHVFNAMRPMHHREPGIAGAALADEKIITGLIADLVHLHPAVMRMVLDLKGVKRVALVTDAVAAVGTRGRSSRLGGRELVVSDAPRLPGGRLAGSILTLDQAIRNLVSLGIRSRDAILMASEVPASVLRRRDLGRIAAGARADLVIFDRRLRVRAVYVGGRPVYRK
ncbi:MAG: N-acetylglucosamine-6-phosphate deacetylase [Armatimonadetes bacterium]|nr:N-acetylglucosamine-6-phosphate deacetylase [Armatimonadota bacterium]